MTGLINSGLKFRVVYENENSEKRLIVSVTDNVVVWKTADLELFEELQYTLRPSSFAELDDPQELDDSRIAAFVAKTRDYKYGILAKRVGPTADSSRTGPSSEPDLRNYRIRLPTDPCPHTYSA